MKVAAILRRLQPIPALSNQRPRRFSIGIGFVALAMISCGDERGASSLHRKTGDIGNDAVGGPAVVAAYLKPSLAMAQTEPATSSLPIYELKIGQKELAQMEATAYSNETYPATFVTDGHAYKDVRVRYRGQWARSWPKKPLKIFLNRDDLFEGQRCLDLNSAWHAPALIREYRAYQVYP